MELLFRLQFCLAISLRMFRIFFFWALLHSRWELKLVIRLRLDCTLQLQDACCNNKYSYIEADGSVTSTATPRSIIARSVQNEHWIATN
uniref:Uncharacterized protein n=2 Tax=Meloidogyne TaxID=189290 RepID=A0A6V7W942_MELEN|nr:unnamed protein product [Meloidogyne enterolobii]